MSTKSENKAIHKAKVKRGKAGIKTHINILKAIQQKSYLSQTLNKGSHTDKDTDSTNQNLKHPLIQTYVNAVETQDTDQDSTVLHPSFSARNVTNMDISPASASQNHRAQMWTLLKRWMLYFHLQSPHIVCRLNSQMAIVWMQYTFVQ